MNNKKVIFITGASSGIGKETAKQLAQEGHIVYGAARSVDKMEDLKQYGAFILKMDVTNEAEIEAAVNHIISEQGKIDVLFNNAGYGLYGSVEEISIEAARAQFEVNLFGLARVTQLVVPHMRSRKQGTIINTSSMGGKMYTPLGAWYHATKHALEGWSDCLRLELQPFGIHVVVLEPGVIETEFGNVVSAPMLQHSGNGPYKALATAVAAATAHTYEKGNGTPATVIANVVSNIVRSPKPKTRYTAGKFAKPMMWVRKWLGDRVFDRVIMSQIKK